MIYQDKLYSKILLGVEIDYRFCVVNTFVHTHNAGYSFTDMFPCLQMPSMLNTIYLFNRDEFFKFRYEDYLKDSYKSIFLNINRGKQPISMMKLKDIVEKTYDTKIKVFNEEKWKIFATLG